MIPKISDLHDCTVAAWVMENASWRFVFDSSDGEWVVQHELLGVSSWKISELCNGIGVLRAHVQPAGSGGITYTIETVCAESIEIVCAEVRETTIKHRSRQR